MIEDEIREILDKVHAQMRRNFAIALRSLNLHVGQEHLLCRLWSGDGVTQQQLCEHLKCEASTVTNMLKTLEKNKLVYRIRDDNDGRISRVFLTEKGREIKEPIEKMWRAQQDKLLNGIVTEERLLLRRILKQMEKNLLP
ncbi:MarR family winged helix-turn-helix transcriptional regulator [Paenibacillus herberti]|uniref:MarR family transcriptional regulator n=1 Tax=Paenibacillus herberti TaxID=1619309 RepID=A0A229NYV8_9BACL|nr:MarR family transcriptional regulator [Paenibacillus herberti]OXM15216.1 MarR family transcriptional regulator [Paenibacillus herberti]